MGALVPEFGLEMNYLSIKSLPSFGVALRGVLSFHLSWMILTYPRLEVVQLQCYHYFLQAGEEVFVRALVAQQHWKRMRTELRQMMRTKRGWWAVQLSTEPASLGYVLVAEQAGQRETAEVWSRIEAHQFV